MKKRFSEGHNSCKLFAQKMQQSDESNFLKVFLGVRVSIFNEFMQSLRAANRGDLLNNFNLINMSLPLEFSIINNYWCAQASYNTYKMKCREVKFEQVIKPVWAYF